jgi:hypothetical protein
MGRRGFGPSGNISGGDLMLPETFMGYIDRQTIEAYIKWQMWEDTTAHLDKTLDSDDIVLMYSYLIRDNYAKIETMLKKLQRIVNQLIDDGSETYD